MGGEGNKRMEELKPVDRVESGTDWSMGRITGSSSDTVRKEVKMRAEMDRFLHVGTGS